MSRIVLILGDSGTGKTASLRNFKPGEIGIVNVDGKELPFREKLDTFQTKDFALIVKACTQAKTNAVFVDDFGFAILDFYVKNSLDEDTAKRDQFEVFKQLAAKVYNLFDAIKLDGNDDRICYFTMHTDRGAYGEIEPLMVGKLLKEKIKLPGKVTICFLSKIENGRYVFVTNGTPPAKTPIGMYDELEIDNDLKAIDSTIRDYYGLAPLGGESDG